MWLPFSRKELINAIEKYNNLSASSPVSGMVHTGVKVYEIDSEICELME